MENVENNTLIGKYINRHLHTDVDPYGKIIGTRGKIILILARVNYESDKSFTPDWHPGGFCANCSNQDEQKYIYTVDESDTFEIRWTPGKSKIGQHIISDKPFRFYDFNF